MCLKCALLIHTPWRKNTIDSGDLMTFPTVPPLSRVFWFSNKKIFLSTSCNNTVSVVYIHAPSGYKPIDFRWPDKIWTFVRISKVAEKHFILSRFSLTLSKCKSEYRDQSECMLVLFGGLYIIDYHFTNLAAIDFHSFCNVIQRGAPAKDYVPLWFIRWILCQLINTFFGL